jgi:hypothetical protein
LFKLVQTAQNRYVIIEQTLKAAIENWKRINHVKVNPILANNLPNAIGEKLP